MNRGRAPSTSPSAMLTIPNLICLARIASTPLLVWFAWREQRVALVVAFLLMTTSDWVDGKLAHRLDQRTELGARLDSLADVIMYMFLIVAVALLDGERLLQERWWLAATVGSYLITGFYGRLKFKRWPSYHNELAKWSWLAMLVAATVYVLAPTSFFAGLFGPSVESWAAWALRGALALVTFGNLYSMALTATLDRWQADVRTLRRARELSRRS